MKPNRKWAVINQTLPDDTVRSFRVPAGAVANIAAVMQQGYPHSVIEAVTDFATVKDAGALDNWIKTLGGSRKFSGCSTCGY